MCGREANESTLAIAEFVTLLEVLKSRSVLA